jgi:aspartyl-tRNA(Asn)/glutamyl-tRNA(Gln) amidotransferase subunit A
VRSGAPFIILFGLPAARKERRSAAKKPDQNGSADAMRRRRNEAAKFNQGKATMPNDPTATPTELHWLTIADAARLIETRRLSPVELTDALLARIEALDPQLNAFLLPTPEKAREQAKAAEREITAGRYRGPLHGIPFGLKDIYATAGIRTTSHSKICENLVPTEDATTVSKLYQAGGVLLGKLATHEFAHGGPSFDLPWPPARNPWNRDHFTGGSSSGAGAAVAAGFVPGALGSDTGGSIRGPAALCGIVGLKPTYGLVSRAGVYANSFTFDHAGPMTWTVEDCAIMLQAIAGHDPKDPASANGPIPDYRAALTGDIRGLRIGIVRHLYEDDMTVAPEVRAGLDDAYAVFRSLGAVLEDVRIRPAADYYAVKITIAESEQYAIHEEELRARPGDFGADFLGRALPAVLYSGTDYVQAQRERRLMLAEMAPIYEKFDVLVTPAAPGPAPRLGTWRTISFWQNSSLTTPFNVTGGPALAQCMGFTSAGLPLSLQLVGRPFDEATVLRAAHAYETATNWRGRRPHLDPAATFSSGPPPAIRPEPVGDPTVRDIVVAACRRAELSLDDSQIDMICAAAPYVMAMTRRLRRERDFREEPANIFRFPE